MAMEQFRAPALPLAPVQYDQRYQDQLNNILRQYFTQLDSDTANKAVSYRADKFIFNLTNNVVAEEGNLIWNNVDQTLNLGLAYGVTNQIGQETYARVANTTGVTIPNGSVVGFAGATDTALLVAPYLADGTSPTLYALGVMTHDLPDSGEKGYCTVWGFVRDLDTSAFSQGDILYASPMVAGGLTNVKPTAPNNVVPIAAVVTVGATDGIIFVRPTVEQMKYYGEFSATTNQTVAVINTPYAVAFDATNISNGVVIGTPTSRLVVPTSGLYRAQITLQLSSTSASAKNFWCWFRKNGVDVPNSAHVTTTDINSGYISVTAAETISMDASDYIEIMYAADSTNVLISAVSSTAFAPAAPAVQAAVTQSQQ